MCCLTVFALCVTAKVGSTGEGKPFNCTEVTLQVPQSLVESYVLSSVSCGHDLCLHALTCVCTKPQSGLR